MESLFSQIFYHHAAKKKKTSGDRETRQVDLQHYFLSVFVNTFQAVLQNAMQIPRRVFNTLLAIPRFSPRSSTFHLQLISAKNGHFLYLFTDAKEKCKKNIGELLVLPLAHIKTKIKILKHEVTHLLYMTSMGLIGWKF